MGDLLHREGHPAAVVRAGRAERCETSDEGVVDFGEAVAKEVTVIDLARSRGVPAPATLAWHRSDDPASDPSWMVSCTPSAPAGRRGPRSGRRPAGTAGSWRGCRIASTPPADFANAVVGDPGLELARVERCGLLRVVERLVSAG